MDKNGGDNGAIHFWDGKMQSAPRAPITLAMPLRKVALGLMLKQLTQYQAWVNYNCNCNSIVINYNLGM